MRARMSVSRSTFLMALAALTLSGCGQGLPPVGPYATVAGRVTDASNGAGLAGVAVSINVILTATTDASGYFKIANVPTGPWQYSVQPPPTFVVPVQGQVEPAPLSPSETRTISIALSHR